jgi:hypothetical protein
MRISGRLKNIASGAKAPGTSFSIFGPAEAVPLLQSAEHQFS